MPKVVKSFSLTSTRLLIRFGILIIATVYGSCSGTNSSGPAIQPKDLPSYEFKGGVYRPRLDFEPEPSLMSSLPVSVQPFLPIRSTVTLDNTIARLTDSSWFCAFNFDSVSEGRHTLHVDGTQYTLPLDTTFVINHNGACYPGYYMFIAGNIPRPLREFVFPSTVGTSWQYRYSYVQSEAYGGWQINGFHVWTVSASSFAGTTLTVLVDDIRKDTLHAWSSYHADTTYASRDTVHFAITLSTTSITVGFPRRFLASKYQVVSRYHDYGSDTLTMRTGLYDTPVLGYCTYVSNVGLIGFSMSQVSNSSYAEMMTLLHVGNP